MSAPLRRGRRLAVTLALAGALALPSAAEAQGARDGEARPAGLLLDGLASAGPLGLAAGGRWERVFADEFDGTRLDTSRWEPYDGPGHAGNGLRRQSAFSVADGRLRVTARMVDGVLVSGGMATRLAFTYGRVEFRVRTDPDRSGVTSGVVLTWPANENWPADGEIDVYETGRDRDRRPLHSYVHFGARDSRYWQVHDADGTRWHTMALEWSPHELRVFRDGVLAWALDDPAAIPRVPHRLCIQLDAFAPSMTGAVTMEVDHVRVFRRIG